MAELIRIGEQRGGSLEEFCKEQGVKVATYYYWRKKLSSLNSKSNFVPLSVSDQLSEPDMSSSGMAIIFFKNCPKAGYVRSILGLND